MIRQGELGDASRAPGPLETHQMALGFLGGLAAALVLGAAPVAAAQNSPPDDDEAAASAAMKEWMSASPEYARLQLDLVKAQAGLAVRIERLVVIGARCELLSEEDGQLIIANARAEMEFGQSVLFEDQQADFALYYEGLRKGAFVAADPGMPRPGECEDFARPGGTLVKLLTWTGRRQFISPGIVASPRTIP
ncbi:hypothetical protein D3C86_918560 [compost metagenome]